MPEDTVIGGDHLELIDCNKDYFGVNLQRKTESQKFKLVESLRSKEKRKEEEKKFKCQKALAFLMDNPEFRNCMYSTYLI